MAETTDPSVLVVLGGPDDDRLHHVSIDGTDVDVSATEAADATALATSRRRISGRSDQ